MEKPNIIIETKHYQLIDTKWGYDVRTKTSGEIINGTIFYVPLVTLDGIIVKASFTSENGNLAVLKDAMDFHQTIFQELQKIQSKLVAMSEEGK